MTATSQYDMYVRRSTDQRLQQLDAAFINVKLSMPHLDSLVSCEPIETKPI